MQTIFSNALAGVVAKHVRLSATMQETLCWLVLLILRFGTVSLWRLAVHVATEGHCQRLSRNVCDMIGRGLGGRVES
jgi:hypothetical protein